MNAPVLRHVDCRYQDRPHRMAVWDWAGPREDAPVVICVHGLTRQGRDFDVLAGALSRTHRVLCPDVVGRGASDWLADGQGYQLPTYVTDLMTMLGVLGLQDVAWVGTSMGGLIGMAMAAMPGSPIRRLVLNDVGPTIEADAVQRIANYVGVHMEFPSVAAAAEALWQISTGFGPHTPEQWLALTRPQLREAPDGSCRLHYDPAIAAPLRAITADSAAAGQALLWQCYDAIQVPTLLLRGAQSDLLSAATAQAMGARGPQARLVELAGVGHAPTLVSPDQVAIVATFLREGVRTDG